LLKTAPARRAPAGAADDRRRPAGRAAALALGGSTGAPDAVASILAALADMRLPGPIFVAIHAPAQFSESLASGYARAARRDCRIVCAPQPPVAGVVYAPGPGRHLAVRRTSLGLLVEAPQRASSVEAAYTPSVDTLFASAAAAYGPGLVAVVLTGLGTDGCEGAARVVAAGGVVLAQSIASCAAAHMPAAALRAGHAVDAGAPDALARRIADRLGARP
jgi:two-component system chemotaxis response regulator CheB